MKFDASIVQTRYLSPLGMMVLAATHAGLAGVWFEGQRHLPDELALASGWPANPGHRVLIETAAQLTQYFAGHRSGFDVPLDLSGGTAFQQSVWQALRRIEPGQTSSYSNVSKSIGNAAAVRAAAAAVARNPVSIIVPCHRVLGSDGSMTGYAGGIDRKAALLRLEGVRHKGLL